MHSVRSQTVAQGKLSETLGGLKGKSGELVVERVVG